jgi:hypothetical protein
MVPRPSIRIFFDKDALPRSASINSGESVIVMPVPGAKTSLRLHFKKGPCGSAPMVRA